MLNCTGVCNSVTPRCIFIPSAGASYLLPTSFYQPRSNTKAASALLSAVLLTLSVPHPQLHLSTEIKQDNCDLTPDIDVSTSLSQSQSTHQPKSQPAAFTPSTRYPPLDVGDTGTISGCQTSKIRLADRFFSLMCMCV